MNHPKGNYEVCNLCLFDLNSNKVDTILKHREHIMFACLSRENKSVFFLTASEIKNYSPVAKKAPHGMEIYELELATKTIRQITHLNEYVIQGLSKTYSDTLLTANMFAKNGLVLINTKTGDLEEVAINSPRNPVKKYFTAIDFRKDSMIYTAPYELYKHNFVTDKSQLILRCPDGYQFGVIEPDETWQRIMFNCGDKTFVYIPATKKLTEVKFKIN